MPTQANDLRTGALIRAYRQVPISAIDDGRRHVGQCLDVINHRWLGVKAFLSRERRPDSGLAQFTFQRFQQGRLFTTNVRSGAEMGVEITTEFGSENPLPDGVVGIPFFNRLPKSRRRVHKLAPEIYVAGFRTNGIGADQRAFDNLMRIAFQKLTIFEGAGLRLVGVDDYILGAFSLRDKAPLDPGREARSTSAAYVCFPDDIANFVGRQLLQGLFQPLVAAIAGVNVILVEVLYVAMTQ